MMPLRPPRGGNRKIPAAVNDSPPAGKEIPGPRGIALLMALSVVMLLTFFMSELFFATGLELRGMTTFKEAEQARALARSVFRVAQIGLLQDEVEFFKGYRQVEEVLQFAAVPWDKGLLLQLDIAPQDHLYNLNELWNQQPNSNDDRTRQNLFFNIMNEIEVPGPTSESEPEKLSSETIEALYSAFFDWIDRDDEVYNQFPSVRGAEADAYFNTEPEFTIKNGMLDRLDEIRLVRGVRTAGIVWKDWRNRFTVLPKTKDAFFYPEKININLASQEDIQRHLEFRYFDENEIEGGGNQPNQKGVNDYSNKAEELARFFAPEDQERDVFTEDKMKNAIENTFNLNKNYAQFLFSTVNQYYRISVVTEVNEVQSSLEALLHIPRNKDDRTGNSAEVVWLSLR